MNVIQFWNMCTSKIFRCIKKGHLKIKYIHVTIYTIVTYGEEILYAKSMIKNKMKNNYLCAEEA